MRNITILEEWHFSSGRQSRRRRHAGLQNWTWVVPISKMPDWSTFKEHWGAERMTLKYWRYPAVMLSSSTQWELKAAKKIFSFAPSAAMATVGRLLYRHVG